MSEHEDLIARLRNSSGVATADVNERVALMDEAADVLEKVTAERNNWKLSAEEAERAEQRAEQRAEEAERERDAARRRNAELTRSSNEKNDTIDELAAQLENVRGSIPDVREGDPELADFFDECVSIAPPVALDHVKAEAWEEGWLKARDFFRPGSGWHPRDNPYRKGESND